MSDFDNQLEGARESAAEELARGIAARRREIEARSGNVSSSAGSILTIGRNGARHALNAGRYPVDLVKRDGPGFGWGLLVGAGIALAVRAVAKGGK